MSVGNDDGDIIPGQIVHAHFDTAETVHISGIALLKMLKNAHSGIPIEVCGFIMGRFVDDYTVSVVDVFPLPLSSGTSALLRDNSQENMVKHLKRIGRKEEVIGWYKSHPGTGVWLSGVDVNTQMQWERSNQRFIAIVIDPIQSVKGKVVIGAFRCISQYAYQQFEECRETTSFIGHLEKPSTKALVRNLNRQYYSMPIAYRMSVAEQQMLMSLNRKDWTRGFSIESFVEGDRRNADNVSQLCSIAQSYRRSILDEEDMSEQELLARRVGQIDPEEAIRRTSDDIATAEFQRLIRVQHDTASF